MDTIRVDICYRPLRIGWAIRAGDFNAFRSAARLSSALWGGRFNPVIVVDHEEQARELVDLFRLDLIVPVGDSDIVNSFPERFPYLLNPFLPKELFIGDKQDLRCQVLDVHNALVYLKAEVEWNAVRKDGLRIYSWAPDDPLADVFLMHFGQYPDPDQVQFDYKNLLIKATDATQVEIESNSPLSSRFAGFSKHFIRVALRR